MKALLLGIACFALLAACSGSGDDSESSGPTDAAPTSSGNTAEAEAEAEAEDEDADTGSDGDGTSPRGSAGTDSDINGTYFIDYPQAVIDAELPHLEGRTGFEVIVACGGSTCEMSGASILEEWLRDETVTRTGDTISVAHRWAFDGRYNTMVCTGDVLEGTSVFEFDGEGGVALSAQVPRGDCGSFETYEQVYSGSLID
ncbi:MAG: hypothetical protein GY788_01375 [bacterium]|nr:hypothetical protein [bacterium]